MPFRLQLRILLPPLHGMPTQCPYRTNPQHSLHNTVTIGELTARTTNKSLNSLHNLTQDLSDTLITTIGFGETIHGLQTKTKRKKWQLRPMKRMRHVKLDLLYFTEQHWTDTKTDMQDIFINLTS
jgi:hypothetical protein